MNPPGMCQELGTGLGNEGSGRRKFSSPACLFRTARCDVCASAQRPQAGSPGFWGVSGRNLGGKVLFLCGLQQQKGSTVHVHKL